jgi:SPP1 gp7 family putative phage head morphogenesis protein
VGIHEKLSSFIDAQNPKLATFLTRQWKQQQNAITYKELREAIFSGQLDMSYLLQWQQDYSTFIAQAYAPLAEKAIKQAAIDLAAAYGGAVFDPQSAMIDNFIKTQGGKLIKEISTAQFNAINTLVRQASMTSTMTVDQLARAIRPCIGLTQRQAAATKHFYDSLIEQGYSPNDALKKQALYAEKMHRRRAATIAQTEIAFAYNAGADAVIQENIKNGYFQPTVTKRWMTAFDERVCDVCGKLDNQSVALDDAFFNGVKLPPAHPLCRCTVAYDNIIVVPQAAPQPAAQPAAQAQPNAAQPTAQPQDNYTPPSIPDAPELNDLKYKGSTQLGTGEMYQYTDKDGQEWIFKPAQSKGGKPEAFRAYVQEAGYKVQSIVDPQSAVPCGTTTLDTPNGKKFGAAQLKVTGTDPNFNLKDWQNGGPNPAKEIITQMQRENVTDWLLCNYDSHGGNFILDDATGTLIGVDKEQAFRYIGKADAKAMSLDFHPNAVYGEKEPIYNTLYRKFAKGEIEIDLNDVLPYIKRVEAVPDAAYREIFREYAESLHGKGYKAEQLLDQIVERKKNLRSTFEGFYSDILSQRKGKPMTFQFVDNVAATTAQPLQATTMSSKALSSMSLQDIKAIAQKQGIKYAYNMNKTQLIDAITDPTKTEQIVADAKARAYGIGTTPRKPKVPTPAATATTGAKAKIEGITQLSEAMDDFDAVLDKAGARGVSLISDKTALEGMQTTLRKVTIDGKEAYELSGKLTNPRWMQANKDIIMSNSNNGSWGFQQVTGQIDFTKPALEFTSSYTQRYNIPTRYIRIGDDVLVITGKDCESSARAMMGEFNIRIYASNGKEAAQKARALLSQVKLDDIIEDVEPISLDRYKKMRLIWQNDPQLAAKLDPVKSSDADIQGALQKLGITQARVDKARLVKVTDDYFTLIDEANEQIAKQRGVAYIWSGVPNKQSAVAIIESGELMSSTQRLKRGIFGSGASVAEDIRTGGADNVFTRAAMQNNVGKQQFNDSFAHGDYQFLFDKKVLTRTDWYAYASDEFGTTEIGKFDRRRSVDFHFEVLNRSYRSSNEVMFRKSLPLTNLQEIRCPSAAKKQELISELNSRGITKINGVALQDLIKIGVRL